MLSNDEVKVLEKEIDQPSAAARKNALQELFELMHAKKVKIEPESLINNLHCHTFYSYNGYGFSPAKIAWLAKSSGWYAAGTIDFDVLDAVDEFFAAAELLDVRHAAGMESRVCVKELADAEINSPGEPGIAYHLGLGFPSGTVPVARKAFAGNLRQKANDRTRDLVDKVNTFLTEIAIDFDRDAVKLTPKGNVTERHVCQAYREKAEAVFPDAQQRAAFWGEKLKTDAESARKLVDNPVKLEGEIRSKTMKAGGVGYVKPTPESFPALEEFNDFIKGCGAIPCVAWLNGLSKGESDPEQLLELHIAKGAEMLNIVPDRNWNVSDPAKQQKLVAEMNKIIDCCKKHHIPVVVGTEMNAPGLKLVDDFGCFALAPHTAFFAAGAAILSAHTLLSKIGRGITSDWAKAMFADKAARNEFYRLFGEKMTPAKFKLVLFWPEKPSEMLLL